MIHLHGTPPKDAVPMIKELQKGAVVEAFNLKWRKGKFQSVGRYLNSDVVYVQHDDGELPTMYFYSQLRIPRKRNLFKE